MEFTKNSVEKYLFGLLARASEEEISMRIATPVNFLYYSADFQWISKRRDEEKTNSCISA